MKVGDLVQVRDIDPWHGKVMVGLVTEVDVFAVNNCDIKVLWQTHTEPVTADSKHLKVINEGR